MVVGRAEFLVTVFFDEGVCAAVYATGSTEIVLIEITVLTVFELVGLVFTMTVVDADGTSVALSITMSVEVTSSVTVTVDGAAVGAVVAESVLVKMIVTGGASTAVP